MLLYTVRFRNSYPDFRLIHIFQLSVESVDSEQSVCAKQRAKAYAYSLVDNIDDIQNKYDTDRHIEAYHKDIICYNYSF